MVDADSAWHWQCSHCNYDASALCQGVTVMAVGTVAGVMMFRNQQCHHGCVHQQISNTALCQIIELMQHTRLMQSISQFRLCLYFI